MKSKIVILLFIFVSSYIVINTAKDWDWWVYKWDKSGYHLYLPAVFIYNDVSTLKFYPSINGNYQPSGDIKEFGIHTTPEGKKVNKYPIGIAVHETPFFLITHFINCTFINKPEDGYSNPYQWCTILSTIIYTTLGLIALRSFLLHYVNDRTTAFTLLLIAFATNLYHYVIFSAGMAHPYAFFQFSLIMLFTDRLYRTEKSKYLYLLALVIGLVSITRISNVLVILIPLFWGVHDIASLKERFKFLTGKTPHLLINALIFLATIFPQLLYWNITTGSWFYYGYKGEGFIWSDPKIWQGLFSFQKGWYIYTPVAFLATIGIIGMRRRFRQYIPVIVIFMTLNIYVVFSWWQWWYGGSFGCRALVEAMAVMALPLAVFIENTITVQHIKTVQITAVVLLMLLVPFNMLQSYQAYKNIIHHDRMTAQYYFKVFLKKNNNDDLKKYLITEEDLGKEIEHRKKMLNER